MSDVNCLSKTTFYTLMLWKRRYLLEENVVGVFSQIINFRPAHLIHKNFIGMMPEIVNRLMRLSYKKHVILRHALWKQVKRADILDSLHRFWHTTNESKLKSVSHIINSFE